MKKIFISNKFLLFVLLILPLFFISYPIEKTFASQSIINSIEKCNSRILNCEKIKNLYRALDFEPVWNEKRINDLKVLIEKSKFEGLDPSHYKVDFSGTKDENELRITNILIKIAYHAYYGFINPAKVFERWDFPKKRDIVLETLIELIKDDRLLSLFDRLSPKYENYRLLKEYLIKYYNLLDREKFNKIDLKGKIKPGQMHPAVAEIRKRLYLLGFIDNSSESPFFDEKLKEAIVKFQKLHNLEPDAIIGKNTIKTLNLSIKDRINQIRINLEKFRWLPESFGEKYILVNIPSFEAYFYDKGQLLLYSRIIAGKNFQEDFRPTPLLYSKINRIIINPDWYVPHKIALKDILPKILKNPQYITSENIKVYKEGEEIDPSTIDWKNIDEKNFNFKLIQKAGKNNALGKIKFHMPNNFDVYLHDTPDKKLFTRNKRAFSSGCIRVEQALPLALMLIENNNSMNWDGNKFKEALKSEKTFYINLNNPVPIYILYFTNLVKDGELYFFDDIYGYDSLIAKHLLKN